MKLPNGYGSVYKLSGNRRRPWIARKTTGWDENGKQLYYTIGYYETRQKALDALAEYNKNPIGDRLDITLEKLYEEWSKSKFPKLTHSTARGYKIAWNHLGIIGKYKVRDIKKNDIQKIIDKMYKKGLSKSSYHKVKLLAGMLLKEAMEQDIINKNYADFVELPSEEKKEKKIFTDMDIKKIEEKAKENEWANTILILIYTGMRIGELLELTKFDIDLNNMLIKGGIKTDAGKNRIIPIHHKIKPYIEYWCNKTGEYLITKDGNSITTDYYRKYLYYPTIKELGIRRLTPHSTRHTFASLMDRAGADTLSIQKIIGHADYSTTANIYTHTNIDKLKKAIESI